METTLSSVSHKYINSVILKNTDDKALYEWSLFIVANEHDRINAINAILSLFMVIFERLGKQMTNVAQFGKQK